MPSSAFRIQCGVGRSSMRYPATAICAIMIAVATASACFAEKVSADRPEYTNTQIKRFAREAHTVEQYTTLADYYATCKRLYKRKAAEEMHIWAERSTMVNPLSEKWPRPVDSARNLHDYYEYKAKESEVLREKYSGLADEAAAKQGATATGAIAPTQISRFSCRSMSRQSARTSKALKLIGGMKRVILQRSPELSSSSPGRSIFLLTYCSAAMPCGMRGLLRRNGSRMPRSGLTSALQLTMRAYKTSLL